MPKIWFFSPGIEKQSLQGQHFDKSISIVDRCKETVESEEQVRGFLSATRRILSKEYLYKRQLGYIITKRGEERIRIVILCPMISFGDVPPAEGKFSLECFG